MAYDELYHWGIKGQKWGVRRYRNEDGTLTEDGKKRYLRKIDKRSRKNNLKGSRDSKVLKEARSKNIDNMTDKELQSYVNRLNLERNYRNLTKKDKGLFEKIADKTVDQASNTFANKIGQQVFGAALGSIGTFLAIKITKGESYQWAKWYLDTLLNQ